jgi:tetratricopeptide (TPR) repeat protein
MTTETESSELEKPTDAFHGHSRRSGWVSTAAIASLPAIVAVGFWWNSQRPENCYRRGRRALLSGERQTVLRESRRLIRTPGFESRGRLLAGLLYIDDGQPIEALQELKLAARDEALAVEALTAAAECYYVSDRYVEAVEVARAALAKDSAALDARRWLAAAYYDLGATGNAVGELQVISSTAPDDVRAERLLGLIDKDSERYADAVGHYRESLRRQPQQPDRQSVLVELAESLVKLSRFDEAQKTLQDCDRTARSMTLAAECEEGLGRSDEALKRLHDALELDQDYLPAILKRGTLLLFLGRSDEAAGALERAVHLAPFNGQAHFHLSQAYTRQGNLEKSAEQLRLFQETQQIEREFTDQHESASQDPNDPEIRYRLGVLARKLGKPELARLWFRAALALEPNHPAARAALAAVDASPEGR